MNIKLKMTLNHIMSIVAGNTGTLPDLLLEDKTFLNMLFKGIKDKKSIIEIANELSDYANNNLC
jgi:hypothetical protein